jgi:hypothetical protein
MRRNHKTFSVSIKKLSPECKTIDDLNSEEREIAFLKGLHEVFKSKTNLDDTTIMAMLETGLIKIKPRHNRVVVQYVV